MQLLQSRRTKRRRPWRIYLIVAVVAATAVGLWQSWGRIQGYYLLKKQDRALQQAKEFIAKHDAPNAQLALDVALKAVPGNPEALRVAADMLEQVGTPQAMRLRRAVVQVAPDSAEDAAKLVLSCLHFRDFNAAKDALSTTPPKVAIQPPMLRAALAFAIATNNSPVADYIFKQLRTEYPNDEGLQQAQALLRLRHPDENRRDEARKELEEIARQDPKLALEINREFISDAMRRNDYDEVRRRQKAILADPAATFTDRLQKANVDLLIDHRPFDGLFKELAPLAAQREADAAQFAQWLLVQNRNQEADTWLSGLPAELSGSPALKSVHADAVAALGQWDRLAAMLRDGAWGPIPPEALRLAFAAQTVDNPNHPSLRRETWDMTLDAVGGNLAALRVLHRLALLWGWTDETEKTLWAIARGFPDQTWAHQALFNLYRDKKDTGAMRDVIAVLRNADGTVPRYQHDWALLTLLTEPSPNWNPAKDIMRQLYEGDPTNATYGTGYAFALAQARKGPEALAVVNKMTDAERAYPPRQPYLAFVYGVAKQGPELEHAATLAQGLNLLPEENYLFTRAREELNRKPEKPKKKSAPDAPATDAPASDAPTSADTPAPTQS